ncbi:MAG: hypothetical protein QME12_01290 [Nanoarchaeota archaeon]|nr:hypothetical protein [Nanoarchaeota archaeon]
MPGKLIILGGVSSVGKTTLCRQIESAYGIANKRLHSYIFEAAKLKPMDEILANWNRFMPDAVNLLVRDAGLEGALTCDIHFAVQPKLDTAYAMGTYFVEDINEPYICGIEEDALKSFNGHNLSLYMLLFEADVDEVISRRIEEEKKGTKKPRSLNRQSLENEMFYEREYFYKAAGIAIKYINPVVDVIKNENGRLDRTLERLVQICNLGGTI